MTLQYVGRDPDSDFSVVHKRYADTRYSNVKVDTDYIEDQVDAQGIDLVSTAYVNSQDALRATKAAVDAADSLYVPTSNVGVSGGLVPLDSSAYIASGNLPTVQTNRKPVFIPATTTYLTSNVTVSTTNNKEYQAAQLDIPDPGYAYIPLLFASVQGGAVGSTPAAPNLGTNNFGQITVLRSDNVKYGWTLCTSTPALGFHTVIPFANTSVTPSSMAPINGASSFGLWLACWGGTTYTFTPTGLSFYCMLWPGM